jgi:hypothetical protein
MGFMDYSFEMGSDAMTYTYIPNSIKIDSDIQKLI